MIVEGVRLKYMTTNRRGSFDGEANRIMLLNMSPQVLHNELHTWKHVLRSLTASELCLFACPVAGGTLEGGEIFLAIGLIDGENVEDWRLAWPPEDLGDIMHALKLLHKYAGVLHGDIEKYNLIFRVPPVPVSQAAGVLIDLSRARTCHDKKAFRAERLALCDALERLPIDISARTILPPIDL